MALFDPVTKKFFCECGCGREMSDPLCAYKPFHQPRTEEHNQRISEALFEYNYENPRFLNEEWCRHISEREVTEEWRQNIADARMGCVLSPEHREAIGNSLRGHPTSQETRERISRGVLKAIRARPVEEEERRRQNISEALWGKYCGEDHWNWEGGYDSSYGYGWSAIRELILIRDNYTCQYCGSSVYLTVHHIDSDKDNIDDTNLITLCDSCNAKAVHNKAYWQDFCKKKIEEIYS
jgi:hypothetical protein